MPDCYTPGILNQNTDNATTFPCGKCPACLAKRISQWSFRLVQQDKTSIMSNFLTLTYDTDNVPISGNGFMSLSKGRKSDLTLFFKRLRKAQDVRHPIRYYAAGEYGTKTHRPHYHIILFNNTLTEEQLRPIWGMGDIHIGTVTEASIGYCLKYINKRGLIPQHKNDDRQREFAVMSKGLGANYLTGAIRAWHLASEDERMYCNLPDGKKCSMPRYYKEKLYTPEQRKKIGEATRYAMILKNDRPVDDPAYIRDRDEAIKAQFRLHKINQTKNDTL